MLVSTVIDRILLQLRDDTSSPTFLTRAEILVLLNGCNRVLAEEIHCFKKRGWIWCQTNVPKYMLPDDLESLLWVTYNGETIEPESVRIWESGTKSWRATRGTPTAYTLDAEQDHALWLYPCPDASGDRFVFGTTGTYATAITDPTGTHTWTWTPDTTGPVLSITGGTDFWDLVDSSGNTATSVYITAIYSSTNNLIFRYSFYPADMTETSSLPKPWNNSDEMYKNWVMAQALLIESEEQEQERAMMYLQAFARSSGIKVSRLLTPQRILQPEKYGASATRPKSARFPDSYGEPTGY